MPIDRMTRARARRALREARARIYDPNVTLIDFGQGQVEGETVEDKLAIRFHVRRKLEAAALESAVEAGSTRRIPGRIGEFETDVIEGTFRPHRETWWTGWGRPSAESRDERVDPMRGGISISDEGHNSYGTLGGLVIDRATGERMILSNWHVLAADWSARVGQRIFQPGRLDGGAGSDTVATLARDAMAAEPDAAVAVLEGSRDLLPEQLGLGAVQGVGQAEIGMEVAKSGRRTGITYGIVRGVEGIARMTYGSQERVIRDVVTIEQRIAGEEVSAPGDSGSWWLDPATMLAIGLHFAGSNSPERALAVAMQPVLDSLRVDIVVQHRGVATVLRRAVIRA